MDHLAWIALGLLLISFLYSCVGHAGASGYIAVFTLFGVAATEIRPIALILNILVATIATVQFARAGHFSWRLFWPFALTSVPAAALGGAIPIPALPLKILLGVVLLFSSIRLFLSQREKDLPHPPSLPIALTCGALLGLLAGLTGTGGGIFLTPLILLCGWSNTRQAAAVSAPFVLVNSLAGLTGFLAGGQSLPDFPWWLLLVVLAGGTAGSQLGSHHLPTRAIRTTLAVVLLVAGIKLITT